MDIIDALRAEFVHENLATRKMLERIPGEALGWKPHPKSMALGRLAGHIAEIPQWAAPMLEQDELDFNMADYAPLVPDSVAGLLDVFDKNAAAAEEAMHGYDDAHLFLLWRLKVGGRLAFELPKAVAIRAMILNHTIHHRGQLSVYLRLKDVPLPSVYGPTADEQQ